MLGPEPNDHKEADRLNRKAYWTSSGIEFDADPSHTEKILDEVGAEDCNLGAMLGNHKDEFVEGELNREEAWRRRSVVARANYLAQGRLDIRYSVNELCREMSKPDLGDWKALEKSCRYYGAGHGFGSV